MLTLKEGGADARGRYHPGKFEVLGGSKLVKSEKTRGLVDSISNKLYKSEYFKLPSQATEFVMGKESEGESNWVDSEGVKFEDKDIYEGVNSYVKIKIDNISKGVDASAYFIDGVDVLLLKGSKIVKDFTEGVVRAERVKTSESYLLNKDKVDKDGYVTENILFTSLSAAASFVIKQNTNGWDTWVDQEGNKLIQT